MARIGTATALVMALLVLAQPAAAQTEEVVVLVLDSGSVRLNTEAVGRAKREGRDASDIFPSSTVNIVLRPNTYLRPYLLDFIQSIAPSLTGSAIRAALGQG